MPARQAGAAPAQAVMLARLVSTNPQPAHPIAVQTAQLDDTRVLLGLHRVTTAAMDTFQTGAHTSQTRASRLVEIVLRGNISIIVGQRLAQIVRLAKPRAPARIHRATVPLHLLPRALPTHRVELAQWRRALFMTPTQIVTGAKIQVARVAPLR